MTPSSSSSRLDVPNSFDSPLNPRRDDCTMTAMVPPPPPRKKKKNHITKSVPPIQVKAGSFIKGFSNGSRRQGPTTTGCRFLNSPNQIVSMQSEFISAVKAEISFNGSSVSEIVSAVSDYWDNGESKWIAHFSCTKRGRNSPLVGFDEAIEKEYISYPIASDVVREGGMDFEDDFSHKGRITVSIEVIEGMDAIMKLFSEEDLKEMMRCSGMGSAFESYLAFSASRNDARDSEGKEEILGGDFCPMIARASFGCFSVES